MHNGNFRVQAHSESFGQWASLKTLLALHKELKLWPLPPCNMQASYGTPPEHFQCVLHDAGCVMSR